jgi:transposase-like protein
MNPSEPRRLCTPEFKAQAVELLAIGRPVVELALEFYVSAHLLHSSKLICRLCRSGA